ncbi:MAG: glycine zipper 2TM domain-containing protein [Gallionella sp.]|nr:glycine zipper 2TM domain-containing protein [Gallionella sp.]MDD4945555.1 glycine zipper 2TM domain-containing protein [Gallionella sp.]MDD5612196.1 glycine zipper 2TM domain-containing protein [Gallionella sp.]
MKNHQYVSASLLALSVLIGGCANPDSRPVAVQSAQPAANYGVIEGIEVVRVANDQIGAGTVIGGIVGGVLGHQVGGGSGRDVATVAGAVGGAVIGHQIEKSNSQQDAYRIRVRLEDGSVLTVTQAISDLRVGDRVRVNNNQVVRY